MSDNQRPSNDNRESRERSDAPGGGSRFGGPQGQRDRGESGGGRRPFGGGGAGAGGGRRGGGGGGGRFGSRRKVCQFCVDNVMHVDYKDIARLRRHVGERGKIEPRRKLGTCAKHQRSATVAIKRARYIGLLPFTTSAGRG
jgi:small subunit ribosomal protein S18